MDKSALLLRDGVALVGDDLSPRPFVNLLLEEGLIRGFDVPPDQHNGDVLELHGAFVLPGLIDCHVHFDLVAAGAAYMRWSEHPLRRSMTCFHNGLVALVHGITSVRDLGCVDDLVVQYARAVEGGEVPGPRVTAAGRAITTTGGHFSQYARVADGPAEVRKAVREQHGAGATVIKIMTSGGISTPGNPRASQFTDEEIRAAVDEAHSHGLRVAAHAHSPLGIKAALAAGVDTVEHAAFADDESLNALVAANVTLVPTVSALNNIEPGLGIPEDVVRKSVEARSSYRDGTRRAIETGVRIAAGTDAGTALNPIGGLIDELKMYAEYGMPLLEVLQSATVRGGHVVGGGVGVLDEGRPADLIIVEGDPRDDLESLRAPLNVIARGRLLDMQWAQQTLQHLTQFVTD